MACHWKEQVGFVSQAVHEEMSASHLARCLLGASTKSA